MPTVKDKITKKTISEQPYTEEGQQTAATIAAGNPNWDIDYSPGGSYDAMNRSSVDYAGGGKTGYGKIGMYAKGGLVKYAKKVDETDAGKVAGTIVGKATGVKGGEYIVEPAIVRNLRKLAPLVYKKKSKKAGDETKKAKDKKKK